MPADRARREAARRETECAAAALAGSVAALFMMGCLSPTRQATTRAALDRYLASRERAQGLLDILAPSTGDRR